MVFSRTHCSSGPPTHPGDSVGEEILGWLHGAQDQALEGAQAGCYTSIPLVRENCVGTQPAHETGPWASICTRFSRGEGKCSQ